VVAVSFKKISGLMGLNRIVGTGEGR